MQGHIRPHDCAPPQAGPPPCAPTSDRQITFSGMTQPEPDAVVPEPLEVTPTWLTGALRRNGQISSEQSVAAVDVAPVGDGISSRSFRFSLEWDKPAEGAPSSLVGKF